MADQCREKLVRNDCGSVRVGDGVVTFTYGVGPQVSCGDEIGSISMDQCENETVNIPCPGNGKLTIKWDGGQQEFRANQFGDTLADLTGSTPWEQWPICDECIKWCNSSGKATRMCKDLSYSNAASLGSKGYSVLPDGNERQLILVKFSSTTCGICHRMSHYDKKVALEEGCMFVEAVQGTPQYKEWLFIADPLYDDTSDMGHPTYVLIEAEDGGKPLTIGEVVGGSDKGKFRENLQDVIGRKVTEQGIEVRCSAKVTGMKVIDGRLCSKAQMNANNPETFTVGVESQCCEPNNGTFRFWDWANEKYVNMHNGMAGVSFPGDGGKQDWGDGPEIKQVKIKLAEFKWDVADAPNNEFKFRWNGTCDQKQSKDEEFQQTGIFKQSNNCKNAKCKHYDVSITVDNNNPKIGETINLTANVDGVPNKKCDYQWYSGSSSDKNNKLNGETKKTLTYEIPAKDAGKQVRFTCFVNINADDGCDDEVSEDTQAFKVKDQDCNNGVPCADPCKKCEGGKCVDKCTGDKPRCKNGDCAECHQNGHCDTKKCEKCENNKCVNKCKADEECDGAGNCVPKDAKDCTKDKDCDQSKCEECLDNGKCKSKCKSNETCVNGECKPNGGGGPDPIGPPDLPGECNDGECKDAWWIDWACVFAKLFPDLGGDFPSRNADQTIKELIARIETLESKLEES